MSGDWDPGRKYQMYLAKIQDILGEEERTVRDIYYALEARGFPKELAAHGYGFEYRYVKRAVKKGRRNGYIDPDDVVDTSRTPAATQQQSHSSPTSFVRFYERKLTNGYFENHWDEQDAYVEVWLEKASLVSVFKPICDEYNVRLEATRGDWSDSKVYEAVGRVAEKVRDGKDVVILYFGDFNPSGLHAPIAIQETMGHYGLDLSFRDGAKSDDPAYFDIWPPGSPTQFTGADGTLVFDRVSITLDEIERFDLPENPTPSSSDKDRTLRDNFMDLASDGRDVNVELNALKEFHRDYLTDRIREAIEEHIDDDVRDRVQRRRDRRQEAIADAIEIDYDDIPGGDD